MMRLPIRLRVMAAFAVAMAVVLAASALFLYLRLQSHLALALDRELRVRTQDLAALVAQPNGRLAADSRSRFVERGESYAQLLAADGRVLDATRPLGDRPLLDAHELRAALAQPIYVDEPAVPGLNEPSRVLASAFTRAGRRLVLAVGATKQDDVETLASFRDELLVAGPIALVLASLVGYLLAGLSLRQVEAMRRRASTFSEDSLGERVPVPPTGDELQRLAETFNDVLAQLEDALTRERRFVADAGHELRTPLALLRTELELALRQAQTAEELRDAVRASSYEVERLTQLAEDLLLIAHAAGGKLPLWIETVSVDDVVATVATRFESRAAGLRKTLTTAGSGGYVDGDRLRLEQALANLVDNALRHGGDHVLLEAVPNDGVVEVHVRDDGRGIPQEFLPVAFDRFTRADPARGAGGAGLGLSIVATIAAAHGGAARIVSSPSGGTDAWIAVPAAVTTSRPLGAPHA